MNKKIKQVISESKITEFCINFNKNFLLYFYNSKTYKLFINLNNFFKNTILKNKDKGLIIRLVRHILKQVESKDIGLFIVLVVLFNTLAIIVLKKEIDIFSISARIFFCILGIVLIFKRKK